MLEEDDPPKTLLLGCWLGNNSRWWLNFILLLSCIFLYFFIFFYIKRCIALCTAKLRARVCNGGYFQMMVGGSLLPGQPLEPLLSPQPSASSHLNMSNPQKYPLPGHLKNLSLLKSPSNQLGGLIRLPRPQCIYSLPSPALQCLPGQHTPSLIVYCLWASIIYTRIYLYLPLFVRLLPHWPTKSWSFPL